MSESRKIHQSDGEQREGDHVALDGDKEFRTSRLSLAKEKASPDGAHEKLLQKEDEAKIVRDMRVDLVDAKYVSGDHQNGDPKIELDANKKQFSGLTKEELMKYADDPFWVNLRWFMFVLFWLLWLGMLAGAITIIIRAPKCSRPTPKTIFEKGPLAELDSQDYSDIEKELTLLQSSKIEAIFMKVSTYDALDKPNVVDEFKAFVKKLKEYSVKVIVDLTPNFVSSDHLWFKQSVNKTAPYTDYFVWADGKGYNSTSYPNPPNGWVSTLNEPAWTWNDDRKAFYLHQFAQNQPDLNFNNIEVVKLFRKALGAWMRAGADGVRLNKARLMLVDSKLKDEDVASGQGSDPSAVHTDYNYYRHSHTADLPGLDALLTTFAGDVAAASESGETAFTLKEEGDRTELFLLDRKNATQLRPPSAAPVAVDADVTAAAALIKARVTDHWPILQLKASDPEVEKELAFFALLLPAAPVFNIAQLDNDTSSESLSHLTALRKDASIEHGLFEVKAVSALANGTNTTQAVLVCNRWKVGHTGYIGVLNPSEWSLSANLTGLTGVPPALTLHHVSHAVKATIDYKNVFSGLTEKVLAPAKSSVLLSYVPKTAEES